MKRVIVLGKEARQKLKEGVNKATEAIAPSLGPKGCSALIYTKTAGCPLVIDDGATIARLLQDDDPVVNAGMALINEVATQADSSGDGCQPYDEKILTPNGWILFKDVKAGDVILGSDGKPQQVLKVYNKEDRDIYKIDFKDKSSVFCTADHMWTVTVANKAKKSINIIVEDLIKTGIKNNTGMYKYYVANPGVTEFAKKDITVDPYTLGLYIGNGYILNNRICIDTPNQNIADYLNRKYKNVAQYDHTTGKCKRIRIPVGVNPELEFIVKNFADKKSTQKFIPVEYLINSVDVRKELLRGLMDTDGSKKHFTYYTASKQLAEDVLFLTRSLGYRTHVVSRDRRDEKPHLNQEGRPIYNRHISYEVRKAVRKYNYITGITKTDRKEPVRCIKVSNADELYITSDFIVTHNTTTGSILANSIITDSVNAIASGASQKKIKQGIELATKLAVDFIKSNSRKINTKEDLVNVATVSSNDKALAELVADAVDKVGERGIIHVENGNSTETTVDVVSGLSYERGYLSRYFVNKPAKNTFEENNCKVLLLDHSFTSPIDAKHVLQMMAMKGFGLLIIADNVEADVLSWFIANSTQAHLKICAIKAPGHGDLKRAYFQDIAKATGATVLGTTSGIELDKLDPEADPSTIEAYLPLLGTANVIVSNSKTVLMEDKMSDDMKTHIEDLKQQEASAPTEFDKQQLKDRIANLLGSVAIINVGGLTDTEVEARKAKLEDAKNATKAALVDGYVCGAGSAYLAASISLNKFIDSADKSDADMVQGMKIVAHALTKITKQLGDNSNDVGDVILRDVTKALEKEDVPVTGYDAVNNKIVNLYDAGIIDATSVVVNSLEKASSIASTVTMTATVVTEQAEDSDKINWSLAMNRR